MFKIALAGLAALFFSAVAAPAAAVPVDVELQLLIDVSGSVDDDEFDIQIKGYEEAFRNAGIIAAIESGDIGAIAVQLVFWSATDEQAIGVDWVMISDAASSNMFADAILAAARPFSGQTAPGSALRFGAAQFVDNGFEGARTVIDVSGDGAQNNGFDTGRSREVVLEGGIDAINGLPILTDDPDLDEWYLANIVGGPNGFLVVAESFEDFANAVLRKLNREITGEIPIPGALGLMLTGIVLLRAMQRRKRAALAA